MHATRSFTRSTSKAVLLACFIGLAACSSSGGGTSPTLTSVQVTPAGEQLPVGITQQYAARGSYSDGSTRDLTAQVTWASTTPATASISATGLATAAHEGSTTITATLGGVSGSTPLAVTSATLRSITVAPASPSIAVGTTQQFAATGHFSNGDVQDVTQQATWASSTPATATVGASGLARAVAAGSTTVSASLGSITGTATLSVTSHALRSIQVTPPSPQVSAGLTVALTATGTFGDGTTQDLTGQATWTSSASAIATVAATGVVTGVAAGSATITATFSGVSGSTPVTVDASVLRSIVVTPVDQPVAVGGTLQLTATGQFSDGDSHDVTAQASWTANPAALVSITAPGLVKGVAAGTAQVVATLSGVSGGTNVTVGSSPAIPDPPPDVAGYFQIMIDNRITSSVTPHFLVTANKMGLTSPAVINPTVLTGGLSADGSAWSDWTAPVFQVLDSVTGTFRDSNPAVTYPGDASFTLDKLPLDPSGQYRILKVPYRDPRNGALSLAGSARLSISLGAPVYTDIVQSAVTNLYSFSTPAIAPGGSGGQQAWDFVEFNCATPTVPPVNGTPVCFINTTNVDFFFLGITVKARQPGQPYASFGLDVGVPGAMASTLAALDALPSDYTNGKINSSSSGRFIRYLAPQNSFTSTTTALDAQITSSWTHYASTPLQYSVTGTPCTATNVNGVLQFTQPSSFQVPMPTSLEVVSSTGPMSTASFTDPLVQNCVKFISAYLNRGVFQDTTTWFTPSAYYPAGGTWNQYSAVLHGHFIQNLAYGFSYDDVPTTVPTVPAGGTATSTTLVLSDH